MNSLSASLFDSYLRHYRAATVVVGILLLTLIIVLGWLSAGEIREVVIEDFNNQQLIIARNVAERLRGDFETLQRELSLLAFSPAVQYSEKTQIGRRIGIVFENIQDEGCRQIRFVERGRSVTHLLDGKGYRTEAQDEADRRHDEWGRGAQDRKRMLVSDIMSGADGIFFTMALPVWQVSVDDAHPRATNKYAGTLVFIIDAARFSGRVAENIRSGKTGYAWIIDNKGIFLYHVEKEFIGKSAFEARMERKPNISFSRINEIQKEMILKGQEGTSWYVSGWHRGRQGEIKKLIAYAPVRLGADLELHRWSVGIVAPVDEVEGALNRIQVRQILLQGVGILIVIGSGLFLMGLMLRWSSSLHAEVEKKTGELMQMESQIAHTEKLASIGTLAAGVAHEINNPLAIILGFTELLLEQAEPGTETYELLLTIERHGMNAKRIVENLLNFSRASGLSSDEMDVNSCVEAVLGVVGNTMSLHNVEIRRRLSQDIPRLRGDGGELQQVLFNIVSNAINAMKGGGMLEVATAVVDEGGKVAIRISDTGPGIPREVRPKVFDPFFTTKRVGEGTGLGLSISYSIILKYCGTITFETVTADEAPVTGTTFIITLPIPAASEKEEGQ